MQLLTHFRCLYFSVRASVSFIHILSRVCHNNALRIELVHAEREHEILVVPIKQVKQTVYCDKQPAILETDNVRVCSSQRASDDQCAPTGVSLSTSICSFALSVAGTRS